MEIPLLTDIVIILGLSIVVLLVFDKLKLPAILGFLVTGAIAGPHALSLVSDVHEVELLAEVGVILLLFIIGIKFSLRELLKAKKLIFIGGGLQVLLVIAIVYGLMMGAGWNTGRALFMGFLLSLSSTAIVLQLLQKRNELTSPHGRTILSILIFQDIVVVPMMLFTPMLSRTTDAGMQASPWMILIKAVLVVAGALLAARWVVPYILRVVVRSRSRELFLISILVICFAIAWTTSYIGLSLSLGAFLAGLIISESEYSNEAMANVAPFYEIFTSFFFISIGMLLNVGFLLEHPVQILLMTISTLLLKALIVAGAVFLMRLPLRTVIIVGLSLAQVGEFAFILSRVGVQYGLLDDITNQYFLSISILTMAVTPTLIAMSHRITALVMKAPVPERIKRRFSYSRLQQQMPVEKKESYKGHLIIIGAGLNGKNLARAARSIEIPYLILELNPDIVTNEKEKGEPIIFGDAVHQSVLEQVRLRKAKVVAVAISDPVSTRRIVSNVRRMDPTIHIIVRTRYVNEVRELHQLGADEVIPEEFETSVEIFSRVMSLYLIPREEIDRFAKSIRQDSYEMFRSSPARSISMDNLKEHIDEADIITMKVGSSSSFIGQKLSEIDIRRRFDVTLLAIGREGGIRTNPSGEETIQAYDKLILFGDPEKIQQFGGYVVEGRTRPGTRT